MSSLPEHQSDTTKPNGSPWRTVDQGAARACVSPRTIYNACRSGQLRHARVGGRRDIRLRDEWIDQWLEASAPHETPSR